MGLRRLADLDDISRGFDFFITTVIISNILVTFLETFEELSFLSKYFHGIEYVTILIFCVEYILRIWTANYLYPKQDSFQARLHFLMSFDGIIDLLTIIPAFFLSGFVIFRMLRVARNCVLFSVFPDYSGKIFLPSPHLYFQNLKV